jgi:hypothetical protein
VWHLTSVTFTSKHVAYQPTYEQSFRTSSDFDVFYRLLYLTTYQLKTLTRSVKSGHTGAKSRRLASCETVGRSKRDLFEGTILAFDCVVGWLVGWLLAVRSLLSCQSCSRWPVPWTNQIRLAIFWVAAPCRLVDVYRRFRGACLPGRRVNYQTTRRNNPDDSHLRTLRFENLKSNLNFKVDLK